MSQTNKDVKHPKFGHLPLSTSGPIDCALTGQALLRSPYLNKGSAFTKTERDDFNLHGTLPTNVQSLKTQVARAYSQYSSRADDLAKNTFMTSMKEQNEVLYYALLLSHLKEMFSVIYTPTEGEAIANYSRLFRRPEGCFLDINDPDGIEKGLIRWGDPEDIDLIVVSDGEQILGIGDQGVGGVLISIAKLIIYTACAGVHPHRTLPVVLDCGTDNKELLDDDMYLGNRHGRVRGERYDAFVDKFISTARRLYPKAYLHCEDFGLSNARRILDKYRDKVPIFNDDVQGTGCVTLAALMGALKVTDSHLKDTRVLCFGAGTAGTGIADMIAQAITVESEKDIEEARKQIWCIDKPGLLLTTTSPLTPGQRPYAKDSSSLPSGLDTTDLAAIIAHIKPHVLIGTSTKPGAFTERAVREMAAHVSRPIILPLSNPTRLHEATPSDLLTWTNGAALVATGSPFDPVTIPSDSKGGGGGGGGETYVVSECNNSTVFPGIGLGGVLSRASRVTDGMLVGATRAVAEAAPAVRGEGPADARRGLLPDVADVREVSVKVAVAVVKAAVEEGVATEEGLPWGKGSGEGGDDAAVLEEWVREQMWEARYRTLRRTERHETGKLGKGEAGTAGRG